MKQETCKPGREDGVVNPRVPSDPLGLEPVELAHICVRVEHLRGGMDEGRRGVHGGGKCWRS